MHHRNRGTNGENTAYRSPISPEQPAMSSPTKAVGRERVTKLCLVLCDALNQQCYKLQKNVCIQSQGSPCADMLVVEHCWTDVELEAYRACRMLPEVLLGKSGSRTPRAIAIRLISHHCPTGVRTANLFEPGRERSWVVPICTRQPFMYVVESGSIPPLGVEQPLPSHLVLLPSKFTHWPVASNERHEADSGMFPDADGDVAMVDSIPFSDPPQDSVCPTCDENIAQRIWTHYTYTVEDRRGTSSLLQAAFLKDDAMLLAALHNVRDGTFLERIESYFRDPQSGVVSKVGGADSLLQRTWMHGAQRLEATVSASPRAR